MIRALVVLALLVPSLAHAQATVTVTLSPDGKAIAAAAGYSEADFATAIKGKVDDAYQTNNVQGFLRSFTDATGFSQRGLGVDYVSVPGSFIIGIAANAAVATDKLVTSSDRPTSGGAAVNFGAMIGSNLGGFGLPRWTIYGNGFYLVNPEERNEKTGYSIPDGYMVRGGIDYRVEQVNGLVVSLGVRNEGVVAHDLFGGSRGSRRPGFAVAMEPGFSYSRGKFSATVAVPPSPGWMELSTYFRVGPAALMK